MTCSDAVYTIDVSCEGLFVQYTQWIDSHALPNVNVVNYSQKWIMIAWIAKESKLNLRDFTPTVAIVCSSMCWAFLVTKLGKSTNHDGTMWMSVEISNQ